MYKHLYCSLLPVLLIFQIVPGTYEIILHQEFVAGRELLLIFTFLQNDLLPTDIQLTTTAGYFHKEPIGEALFLVPMAFCTPFSAHAAFYYGEALLTTINTSTYNATPQKGDLMDSLKPRTESDKISGEVRLYCDFISKAGSDCSVSPISKYGDDKGNCTHKKMNSFSTLRDLKPNGSYLLECFDRDGYTTTSSLSYEVGNQTNIFLEQLQNTRLPNPNEGEIICPTDRDSVKVEGVDVKTLGDSLVHLVSWKEMDEKYSQCLSYYVINRIQRRLKPEFSILSVVKFRVDGHLNNVIDDVDEDHDYVYKVKAFFKNCERTRFSERVLIRTSKAPAQNCNCTVSDSQNHTGILVPSLVLDVRHEIL